MKRKRISFIARVVGRAGEGETSLVSCAKQIFGSGSVADGGGGEEREMTLRSERESGFRSFSILLEKLVELTSM